MNGRTPGGVLLQTSDGWQAVSLGASRAEKDLPNGEPDEVAAQLRDFFDEHRLRHDRLLIATHAVSTLMTSFPVAELSGVTDRRTITFRLESALPLDAESIAADYHIAGDSVICIAASMPALLPIVEALEAVGLQVQSVVAAMELIADSARRAGHCKSTGPLVLAADDELDLLTLSDGIPSSWRRCTEGSEVRRALLFADEQRQVTVLGSSEVVDQLLEAPSIDVTASSTIDLAELLRRGATHILRGQRDPWFELRRGRLAEAAPYRSVAKSLQLLLTTLAVTLVLGSGALFWRGSLYEDQLAEIRSEERALFTQAFPDSPVPRAVLTRLRSEHTKVLASRRETADVPAVEPALWVLRTYLEGLPADVRCQTSELAIDDGELTADLRLNRHEDAGLVANALQQAGFEIEPPTTTQQEDRTINSRMIGRWAPTAPPAAAQDVAQVATRGDSQ